MHIAESSTLSFTKPVLSFKHLSKDENADFRSYQNLVLTPLHTLFSDRIKLADASLHKLSSRLSSDAQSQSPNLLQEEGDAEPELLEILTQAKVILCFIISTCCNYGF